MRGNVYGKLITDLLALDDEGCSNISFDGFPPEVIEALERKQAEAASERAELVAGHIMKAMRTLKSVKDAERMSIRKARINFEKTRKHAKARMDTLDRALAYGQETGNLIPLLKELGSVGRYSADISSADWGRISTIPEDWTPKSASVSASVSASEGDEE